MLEDCGMTLSFKSLAKTKLVETYAIICCDMKCYTRFSEQFYLLYILNYKLLPVGNCSGVAVLNPV